LLPDASFYKDIQEEEIVKNDERKNSIKKASFSPQKNTAEREM
jgi:hypothetical protein